MIKKTEMSGDFFSSCELSRLSQLEKAFMTCEEFLKLSAQRDDLYNQLKAALPDQMRNALVEYWDTNSHIMALQRSYFYKHGFSDACSLTQTLLGNRKSIRLDINIT